MTAPTTNTAKRKCLSMIREETFLYVRHEQLAEKIQEGWIPTHGLTGTHHGFWSTLCRQDKESEEWRPVVGYEDHYEVSSFGRVRSIDRIAGSGSNSRRLRGKLRKQTVAKSGYFVVPLPSRGGKTSEYVSHMVAEAFIGPRPDGMEVAHNDGYKLNNRADNLRYATPAENTADKDLHGTMLRGETCPASRLTEQQVREIRRRAVSETCPELAAAFDLGVQSISDIIKRRNWRHLEPLPNEVGSPEGDALRKANMTARSRERMIRFNRGLA